MSRTSRCQPCPIFRLNQLRLRRMPLHAVGGSLYNVNTSPTGRVYGHTYQAYLDLVILLQLRHPILRRVEANLVRLSLHGKGTAIGKRRGETRNGTGNIAAPHLSHGPHLMIFMGPFSLSFLKDCVTVARNVLDRRRDTSIWRNRITGKEIDMTLSSIVWARWRIRTRKGPIVIPR